MDRKRLAAVTALAVAVLLLSLTAWAGKDSGAWMGIYTQTVDPDLKEAFDLDSEYGVIVKMVVPDSPADEAGIRQGDIILMIDKEKMVDADDLIYTVKKHQPGDMISVKVSRKGTEKVYEVELGEHEKYEKADDYYFQGLNFDPHSFSKTYKFHDSKYADTYIGVSLQNLNEQLGEYFGVEDGKGALISEVMADSPAEKAGVKAGDVIISIDGDPVIDPADVSDAVGDKDEGDAIELIVLREKNKKRFSFEVEKSPRDFHSFGNFWVPDDDEDIIFFPKMKGMFKGDFDDDMEEYKDFRDEMEDLREELKEMQKELQEMRKKLE